MADPAPFQVQPLDAIRFLKNKVRVPTTRWNDLWQEMHGAAFMVAGAQKAALLEDFHAAVTAALENGTTLAQFRNDFDRIVEKHGWNYHGSRNWRSQVIYRTNMRAARSAGRWAQIQQTKKHRPYLHYTTANDNRVRPGHKVWHNLVLPVDHPFWETHYPPNGWSCRCQADSLSERDLKRLELKVSDDPEITWENREMNTATGKVTVRVPEGIHTGFAYNPGIAGFGRGTGQRAAIAGSGFEPLVAPGAKQRSDYPDLDIIQSDIEAARPLSRDLTGSSGNEDQIRAELERRLRQAIGGDEFVFTDPTGNRVRITRGIVDHMMEAGRFDQQRERFFPFIPELLTNPAEIWVGFAQGPSGKVELRRRYVRLIRIRKNRVLGLVADIAGGEWLGLTFFSGNVTGANQLRTGLRVFGGI